MKYKQWKKSITYYKQNRKKTNQQKFVSNQAEEEKSTLFQTVVKAISCQRKLVHFFIVTLFVILGFIFNAIYKMPMFGIKVLFVFALDIFLFYTIIYIEKKSKDLKIELTGDPQLAKCQYDYEKKINSNSNFILCFWACIYFVTISILLGFVEMNLLGIYCLLALAFVVFEAFIVFQQYIFILSLLYSVSNISPGNFYEIIPEKTDWFKLLESFSNNCRNMFIILGSLFIILFVSFSPLNSIQIIFQEGFSDPMFIPLLCTWIIILFAIVFMIPFSSFVRSALLKKIYNNLITQSIENYNRMFAKASNGVNKIVYMDIILRLCDRSYVLQNSYTWVVPLIVSIVNFSSIVISIVADLKDLNFFA